MENNVFINACELFILSTSLFVFFLSCFFPLGALASLKLFKKNEISPEISSLLYLSISFILYSTITSALIGLKLNNDIIKLILFSVVAFALFRFLKAKNFKEFLKVVDIKFLLILFLYYTLINFYSSFPVLNFRDSSPEKISDMVILPIDNLIPYNFSRYLVERIDPKLIQIVPGWQAGDRGPLAGILNAFIFLLLGIKENKSWLTPTENLYFVFQSLMIFLNSLPIYAVMQLSKKELGRSSSKFAPLFLCSTYFVLQNTIFSWPKFFMSFFVISACYLSQEKDNIKLFFISGALLALSALSHDSGLFFCCSFFALILIKSFNKELFKKRLKLFFSSISGFVVFYLPWLMLKNLVFLDSKKGLHYLLLCRINEEAPTASIGSSFVEYIKNNNFYDLLLQKLETLFYPVNPIYYSNEILKENKGIIDIIYSGRFFNFLNFFTSIGAIFFILAILGLIKTLKLKLSGISFFTFCSFGALIVFAIIAGCEKGSTNHHGFYPLFLAASLLISVSIKTKLDKFIFFIAFCINTALSIVYLIFHGVVKIYLHSDKFYFICLSLIFSLLVVSCLSLKEKIGSQNDPRQ